MPVEIAQTGCQITLTFDLMSTSSPGPLTTDSATLSSTGAFAASFILPSDGSLPGYAEGSASSSAGTLELGAASPRMRICGFTLSR